MRERAWPSAANKLISGGDLENGYYVKPTVFVGHNKMRIFQEEIFDPVLSVTKFKNLEDAIAIGNDTVYGLGAGFGHAMPPTPTAWAAKSRLAGCGQTAVTLYPAHAAFGGYKQSGFGRETHKMILDHYPQTKNLRVSYSPKASGFF